MPRRCSAGTAELGSRQIRALCEISVRENWEHAQEPGRKAEEVKTLGAFAVRMTREEGSRTDEQSSRRSGEVTSRILQRVLLA